MEGPTNELRPAPTVINVPSPDKVASPASRARGTLCLLIVTFVLTAFGVSFAIAFWLWWRSPLVPIVVAILSLFGLHLGIWWFARWCRKGLERHLPDGYWEETLPSDSDLHPVALWLRRRWRVRGSPPGAKDVRAAVGACLANLPPGVLVVVVGRGLPNAMGVDDRFQPVILTAGRMFGLWLRVIAALVCLFGAALVVARWYLDSWGVWALRPAIPFALWGSVLLVGYLWGTYLRPRYIRIAPGMIQVLTYPWLGRGRPFIRSFPMVGGTLVTIHRRGALADPEAVDWQCVPPSRLRQIRVATLGAVAITLERDSMRETINVFSMHKPHETLDWMLRAIFSTAPTPPLSEETLLG